MHSQCDKLVTVVGHQFIILTVDICVKHGWWAGARHRVMRVCHRLYHQSSGSSPVLTVYIFVFFLNIFRLTKSKTRIMKVSCEKMCRSVCCCPLCASLVPLIRHVSLHQHMES